MEIKRIFLLHSLVALICLGSTAWAEFEIDSPEGVDVGSPFFLKVRGPEGFIGMDLRWQGKQVYVPANRGEAIVLLGAPLELAAGVYPIVGNIDANGRRLNFVREISVRARTFPEQRLRVDRAMVDPDPSHLPRIKAEQLKVRQVLDRVGPHRYWEEPFPRPVGGSVSSVFGLRRFFNDQPRAPHRGVDLRGAEGTPVRAFSAGEVALTGDHYFAGKSVYIDHGLGLITQYIHLSEITVAQGQTVSKGQVIGKVGSTGRVTGPHLHFGLSLLGMWVDPMPLFE